MLLTCLSFVSISKELQIEYFKAKILVDNKKVITIQEAFHTKQIVNHHLSFDCIPGGLNNTPIAYVLLILSKRPHLANKENARSINVKLGHHQPALDLEMLSTTMTGSFEQKNLKCIPVHIY